MSLRVVAARILRREPTEDDIQDLLSKGDIEHASVEEIMAMWKKGRAVSLILLHCLHYFSLIECSTFCVPCGC